MEILIILFFVSISSGLQCLDENNNPVDWYVYKLINF